MNFRLLAIINIKKINKVVKKLNVNLIYGKIKFRKNLKEEIQ